MLYHTPPIVFTLEVLLYFPLRCLLIVTLDKLL